MKSVTLQVALVGRTGPDYLKRVSCQSSPLSFRRAMGERVTECHLMSSLRGIIFHPGVSSILSKIRVIILGSKTNSDHVGTKRGWEKRKEEGKKKRCPLRGRSFGFNGRDGFHALDRA
ncbi:hypothetical protein AA313_de0207404 [Arthrobotrys entomopaga]|nr:hypothetical protein AA313_de0207404 [Arthrobotrys entomopaga]